MCFQSCYCCILQGSKQGWFFFFFPDSASDCSAVKLLLTSEKYSNGNMNLFQIAVQVLCRMNSSREPEFYLFRKNKLNYMALKG